MNEDVFPIEHGDSPNFFKMVILLSNMVIFLLKDCDFQPVTVIFVLTGMILQVSVVNQGPATMPVPKASRYGAPNRSTTRIMAPICGRCAQPVQSCWWLGARKFVRMLFFQTYFLGFGGPTYWHNVCWRRRFFKQTIFVGPTCWYNVCWKICSSKSKRAPTVVC